MQKHYKLTIGLLACALGTNLKGAHLQEVQAAPASIKRDLVADLRAALGSCEVLPCHLACELLTSRAYASPDARLNQARKMVNKSFYNVLHTVLSGAPATDGTAAARQAAEGMKVGSTIPGGVELEDAKSVLGDLIERGEMFTVSMTLENFLIEIQNSSLEILNSLTKAFVCSLDDGTVYFGYFNSHRLRNCPVYSCSKEYFDKNIRSQMAAGSDCVIMEKDVLNANGLIKKTNIMTAGESREYTRELNGRHFYSSNCYLLLLDNVFCLDLSETKEMKLKENLPFDTRFFIKWYDLKDFCDEEGDIEGFLVYYFQGSIYEFNSDFNALVRIAGVKLGERIAGRKCYKLATLS